ncbi:uclacyanin 1-like [Cucurbita pepo subsp. pepo]|uniref:uclacyanin 1-like n=1 Tax=Cucurbita pepo subsp. pepo TaxID=3664 RepID=UPI000C9D62B9|nr:uclacyanin 1-like [Cucurbita pepo subsp. pepo]
MEALRLGWGVRVIIVMVITAIFFRCVTATNHSVGGASGWDLNSNILTWSAATTFQVDDYLVFNYLPVHDVLEVNRTDFSICRTVNPITTHSDGKTVIHLDQPGSRYFICGRLQYCLMGLKLQVQVLQRLSDANNSTPAGANQPERLSPRHPPHSSPPFPHHPPPRSPPPLELPPLPDRPEAPSPCICSGVGEMMMASGPMNWCLVLLFIMLATRPCFHSLIP